MKFYALADIGDYPLEVKKMLALMVKDSEEFKTSFISIVGDNFYYDGVYTENCPEWKQFKKRFQNMDIYVYPVLGNHDYIKNPRAQLMTKKFGKCTWDFPNFYYFKKISNNIGCWFLDSQILAPHEPGEEGNPYQDMTEHVDNKVCVIPTKSGWKAEKKKQIEWLKETLEENKDLPYKFFFGHYPMVSMGRYKSRHGLPEILMPLMKKYNVSAYISGHDHNAQHIVVDYKGFHINQLLCGATMEGARYPQLEHFTKDHLGNKVMSHFFTTEVCFLRVITKKDEIEVAFMNLKGDVIYGFELEYI